MRNLDSMAARLDALKAGIAQQQQERAAESAEWQEVRACRTPYEPERTISALARIFRRYGQPGEHGPLTLPPAILRRVYTELFDYLTGEQVRQFVAMAEAMKARLLADEP